METMLGMIYIVPFDWAPVHFSICQEQLVAVSQNTALFSLLGTFYGGNGQTNFALPNLQGRAPLHAGQGPGLSNYDLGQTRGKTELTLIISQLPSHTHTVFGTSSPG